MIVRENQNIIDFALRYYGSVERAFDIAQNNAMSLSDTFYTFQEIGIDTAKIIDATAVQYFENKNKQIVTGQTDTAPSTAEFSYEFTTEFGGEFNA